MRTPEKRVDAAGRVTYKVRFRDDDKMETSRTFDTLNDAKRFDHLLAAVGPRRAQDQLDADIKRPPAPPLDEFAASHIRFLTGVEPGTRLSYQRMWARAWGPLIGDLPASAVTRDRVAEATNTLAARYAPKTLKNLRGLLAAVCERAVEEGYLTTNPTKRLRLPRTGENTQTEMRILTQPEFAHLVEHTHPHYQSFVRFLGATGARWGEAVALSAGDLDLSGNPTVRIHSALKWSPDNKRTIGPTKTRKSNRTVALPHELVAELAELVAGKGKGDPLFTAPRGGPVRHRTFWHDIWLPALKAAGLEGPPRPRIHDLRHSHASWLLAGGVPIHVVQARLGHENITTTVDTYGSLMPDAQIAAAHAASLALTPTPEIEE